MKFLTLFSIVCAALLMSSDFTIAFFDEKEIDSVLKDSFKCQNNPSLAVSVVKDGKVIFSGGYGTIDKDTKDPVTDTTLFGIASVSKSFAATLLVKLLYEKTKLNVNSKVSYLIGDKFQMPDYFRTRLTTFADLMGHRTGVPKNNRIRFNSNITRENLIQYISKLSAPHEFRVQYFYSNLMYGLATYLAEVIGNSTWEQLITEHLFDPLGMNKSTFATVLNFSRPDVAIGYRKDSSGVLSPVPNEFSRRWGLLAGSGAIVSSAKDMAQWMNFHLSKGKDRDGRQVMAREHVEEVHKPRMVMPPTYSKDTRTPRFPVTSSSGVYAFGFRRGFYRGYEKLTHTGSTPGYQAMMSLLPEQNIGVFTVLSGKDSGFVYRLPLNMYLMDKALGIDPWLNVSTICSYPKPWKPSKKPSSPLRLDATIKLKRDVSEYEGTYCNKPYGSLTISYNESLASLMMTFGWGTWRLFSRPMYRGDKFYGDGVGTTAVFDVSPIEFIPDKRNKSLIVAVKATAFDNNVPPLFKKTYNSKLTSSIPTRTGKNTTLNEDSVKSADMKIKSTSLVGGNYSTSESNTTLEEVQSSPDSELSTKKSIVLSSDEGANVTLEERADLKKNLDGAAQLEPITTNTSSISKPNSSSSPAKKTIKCQRTNANNVTNVPTNQTQHIQPAYLTGNLSSSFSSNPIHMSYLLPLACFISSAVSYVRSFIILA